VEFENRDIENHAGALDELRSLGFRTVPVTVIGDRKITGFRPNDISEALMLGVVVAPREPSETLPILDRLIIAHLRAIQQMPKDKLDYKAPDRDRPMREFGYHVFRNIQRTTQAINTGVFPMEDQASQDLPGRSFQSFEEIASFGEEVLRDYRDWATKQDMDALKSLPSQGSGLRSGAEQLDLIAGHTTQHLRQLYYLLESFGIGLDDRIQDSDLPQEYILTLLW
jgi:hypothetical protein